MKTHISREGWLHDNMALRFAKRRCQMIKKIVFLGIFAGVLWTPSYGSTGFKLQSTGFKPQQLMNKKYTAFQENVSPPLQWSGAPKKTKEFALIVDDPDAAPFNKGKPFTHWVVYGISAETKELQGGIPKQSQVQKPVRLTQGKNSVGEIGYFGPKPPDGSGVHHYRFRLYALDRTLDLAPGLDEEQVLKAIEGHVVGESELVGLYEVKSSDS